jgi:transcriptional regulator with XRE-family HTH domain
MKLETVGKLIAERRRSKRLKLQDVAAAAGVGRSTLAALEAGTLSELGFAKVARICAALDLVLEVRPPTLERPLMSHRHLTEAAGRELTKAAIEDVIVRGDFASWRGLVAAMRADRGGRIATRVRDVAAALDQGDTKVHAFTVLLPELFHQDLPRGTPSG